MKSPRHLLVSYSNTLACLSTLNYNASDDLGGWYE